MSDFIAVSFRSSGYFLKGARSRFTNCLDHYFDSKASSFYTDLIGGGFAPNSHIDVLPQHGLLYVCIPKCASTTIKMILSTLARRKLSSVNQLHKRRYSGLKSPAAMGISAFHQLATHPSTLRFSFVRNPYARLVSAWADKFQDKALVFGNSFIDQYLMHRRSIDSSLPEGPGRTLSFAQFVQFATATADLRLDAHWHLQDDLLSMPGIALDAIGKVESFEQDIMCVLDHVGAGDRLRQVTKIPLNSSRHQPWADYYTSALADNVYRAYQRDFDRFEYSRKIPTGEFVQTIP